MTTIADRLARAPISWGVCEVADWGWQLDAAMVLSQMQELGLVATEFGPDGFLPDDAQDKSKLLADKGLFAVGGFVPVVLHDPSLDPLRMIHKTLRGFKAAGATSLVLAAATGTTGYDGRQGLQDDGYRPMFWDDPGQAHTQVDRALSMVTVALGNRAECEVAVGESDPDRAAEALLGRGIELAIVKRGPDGVLARTRDERVEAAAFPVEVVNGLGAGDAFGGALCHGLLAGWPLERVLGFANVAGAIVASRLECSTAMPTEDEVEERMGEEKNNKEEAAAPSPGHVAPELVHGGA
jgi:hypothetical protein